MKRWGVIPLALCMSALLAPVPGGTVAAEEAKANVLVVGVRDDVPPFGFIDRNTGELAGIDVDLARAIAQRLNVQVRFRSETVTSWIPDLIGGNADLVAGTITYSPDRAKLVDFTSSYFDSSQLILAKKGTVTSLKDLEGKRIGTARGSAAERILRTQVPGAACYFFVDSRKAVEALRNGEVDALAASGPNLYGCLSSLPKEEFEIPGTVKLSEEGYRFAVRKGDDRLLKSVNAALDELKKGGGGKAIFDKWFVAKEGSVAQAAVPGPAQATGVVTRVASAEGRFVTVAIKGAFVPGADVSIFSGAGEYVGNGTVENVYEDEVYIDARDTLRGVVQPGFAVTMNMDRDESRKTIVSQKAVIDRVKSDAKAEAEQIGREIAVEAKKAKADRERYQEDMAKTKMLLNYQYNTYYRYGYPLY